MKKKLTFTLLLFLGVSLTNIRLQAQEMIVDELLLDIKWPEYLWLGDPGILVDETNTYHFIFQKVYFGCDDHPRSSTIYYTRKRCGESWSEPEPVSPEGWGYSPYMVVDSQGRVIVAYSKVQPGSFDQEAVVATKTPSGWVEEIIPRPDVPIGDFFDINIVTDASGGIHATSLYYLPYGNEEKQTHSIRTANNHESEFQDLNPGSPYYKRLKDNDNRYYQAFLIYSNNLSGQWETRVIENALIGPYPTGTYPRIAVNDDGTAHIMYRTGTKEDDEFLVEDYSVVYATNLMPDGHFWEHNILECAYRYCSPRATIQRDNVLHLLTINYNAMDEPRYTEYFRKESYSDWEGPIMGSVSHPGVGFSPQISPSGVFSFAYLAQYGVMPLPDLWLSIYNKNENAFYDRNIDLDWFFLLLKNLFQILFPWTKKITFYCPS
jgi:hypothetical protein